MIDSCRDELLHHTFTSPPFQFLPTALITAATKTSVHNMPSVRCAAHTSSSILSERPQLQTKKLLWMFIMYRVFFPFHIPEIISFGGAEWARWIVECAYLRKGGWGGFFWHFSYRCTAFMGLPYNPFAPTFVFLTLLRQRGNADFGLRKSWTKTFHPRIWWMFLGFMNLRRPTSHRKTTTCLCVSLLLLAAIVAIVVGGVIESGPSVGEG